MAVYVGENSKFFEQSIESMLAQTVPANEFVLVCDGPLTVELDAVIARYEESHSRILNVVRLDSNVGLAAALNIGLQHCTNDLVARMDSDDIANPIRMKQQLDAMGDADIIGCAVAEFMSKPGDLKSIRQLPTSHEEIICFARRRNPFNHPSVLYKKSIVQQVGGYEDFPLCEDYQLWVKMFIHGCKAVNIPESLINMRVGSGLYRRRGGFKYFKTMYSFRRWMRQVGFSGLMDFWICVTGHLVSCFIPSIVRRWVYSCFFRMRGPDKNQTG